LVQPLHKTKGIVLRVTKYGDSGLIALIYTELFGIQSYLVQGVRSQRPQKAYQSNYFQPGAILELIVYHHEQKSLQRIKEFKWGYLYQDLMQDVFKNSVLIYMVELMIKTIRQPETNADLFAFLEDALIWLDKSTPEITSSYALYFSFHLCSFFGFQISNTPDSYSILDLSEGKFTDQLPNHPHYAEGSVVITLRELLKVMHPEELAEVPISRKDRQEILEIAERYYQLHLPEFGKMKTVPILKQIMS
jgi:DNA repair protein RecO (recombination protein O)